MQIRDYPENILDIISASPYIESKSVSFEERPPNAAYITGILTFINSSKLHFKEVIEQSLKQAERLRQGILKKAQVVTLKNLFQTCGEREIKIN
ncbi:MAG: hypothetical protein ACUBOA_01870 [Candidatus Loosdrechtia sp.]|uniref:hypothetical protein n=1 Tax=Candidatus Loosdrechtia sp. TaxID=3101272 RepID=UPI003A726784|nr:MAG: hypothetical protein QY305_12910 [Candidatus Jettenia sp. AMX2]